MKMENHFLCLCGLILISLLDVCKAVKINSIEVPKRHDLKHDGTDTIEMHCDFEVNGTDTGFVLKWLHNNAAIYQWIPSKKVPFALGAFKGRVDMESSSSDDRLKKHSALIITKPLLSDSGNYTCNVQTFQGSDKQSAEMQIIDPEDSINLTYKIEANDSVSLQCSVENIYPLPEVKLLFDNEEREEFQFETETKKEGELYDITISTQIRKSDIKDESPVTCVVNITNSDYTKRETITYDDPKISPTKQSIPGEITKHTQSEADAENDAKGIKCSLGLVATMLSLSFVSLRF